MEGLAAFFLESTFLGLWIFGWGRLGKRLHLATIYAVAIGTNLSAFFILAANSWMQHPVGYKIDPATGHARLTSILEVLTNSTVLWAFPHTIGAAVMTAGMLVAGVSAWHLRGGSETAMFGRAIRIALPTVLVASLLTAMIGHGQAQLMTRQQPLKMAAAEALYTSRTSAPFSLFAVAPFEQHPNRSSFDLQIPNLLSVLATNTLDGKVEGVNTLQAQYQHRYGQGDYRPVIGVTYWAFRIMTGIGVALVLLTGYGMWLLYRGSLERSHRFLRITTWAIALPILANTAGWIFTEMGRQPWVVQGLLLTRDAVSPSVSAWEVATTLIGFTLLYTLLGIVDGWLMFRYARAVPPETASDSAPEPGDLAMAY
jgi:cytochrome d ubiquinol oxidase subunit I